MMSKKIRKPVIRFVPKTEKKAKLTPSFEKEEDTVIFSFLWFDSINQWGTGRSNNLHSFWELAEKIISFEQKTWREIAGQQDRDHSIPFSRLIPKAQELSISRNLDEYDEIWSFHFTGTQRLWGVKYDKRFFMAIWWDPEHQIWPSLMN